MWQTGTVVGRIEWTEHLFSLKIKAPMAPFEAGQFIKLSQMQGGKRIARAYSLINAPEEDILEVLITYLPNGQLSRYLHRLQLGDPVEVTTDAAGYLVLSELPQAEDLVFLATGSGVGPMVSMLRDGSVFEHFNRVSLVYSVRHQVDLAYADEFDAFQQDKPQQFQWLPCVTRDEDFKGLNQRIPTLIKQGVIEQELQIHFAPDKVHVLLCGNPGLIHEGTEALLNKGLARHRRQKPGHISVEKYW